MVGSLALCAVMGCAAKLAKPKGQAPLAGRVTADSSVNADLTGGPLYSDDALATDILLDFACRLRADRGRVLVAVVAPAPDTGSGMGSGGIWRGGIDYSH